MYHTVPTSVENIPRVTEDEVLDVVKESEITQSPAMIEYLIRHRLPNRRVFPDKVEMTEACTDAKAG